MRYCFYTQVFRALLYPNIVSYWAVVSKYLSDIQPLSSRIRAVRVSGFKGWKSLPKTGIGEVWVGLCPTRLDQSGGGGHPISAGFTCPPAGSIPSGGLVVTGEKKMN